MKRIGLVHPSGVPGYGQDVREHLGCVGVLAVASLLSGVGFAAVAGTVLSLFIGPIIVIVGGVIVLAVLAIRDRR